MWSGLMLAGLLAPADALAQGVQVLVTAGVSVSLEERPRAGFVADTQVGLALAGLAPEVRGFARFGWVSRVGPTFTTGGALGVVASPGSASGSYLPFGGARVEYGRRFRRGPDCAWLGVGGTIVAIGNVRVGWPLEPGAPPDAATPLPDAAPGTAPDRAATLDLALGVPLVPVWIDGRPVRDGDAIVRAEGRCAGGGLHFAEGLEEHAAVLAFRRLAVELHAVRAPRALIGRVLAAEREEAGHAAMCFGLAARGGGDVVVAPMCARLRGGDRRARLRRLYAESIADGVINEGAAALRAEAEASAARDPVVAAVKARIAREEAGHARLARDVARWCRAEL